MSEETPKAQAHRQLIDEAMVEATQARREFKKASARDQASSAHIQALRDAVVDYHDALKRYRSKSAAKEVWQDHGLDRVDRLLQETQQIEQDNPAVHGQATQTVTVPKLRMVGPNALLQFLDGFDEVADRLGFSAEVVEQTPHEIGTKKDIRWLLKARDQKQALEELEGPEQDSEEVANA